MRTFTYGALASLGLLVACETEQKELGEAAEEVRQETKEAGQEVQREVQEGREEVAEARRELVVELRDLEKSGEPVEFDAVVTGHDPDTMNLRLESGETFDVDYGPAAKITRGTETVTVADLQPGTMVHITYRFVDGKRMVDMVTVKEGTPLPTPGTPPTPGAGGGTQ